MTQCVQHDNHTMLSTDNGKVTPCSVKITAEYEFAVRQLYIKSENQPRTVYSRVIYSHTLNQHVEKKQHFLNTRAIKKKNYHKYSITSTILVCSKINLFQIPLLREPYNLQNHSWIHSLDKLGPKQC